MTLTVLYILYPQVGRGLESKDSNDGSRISASNGITSIRSGVEGAAGVAVEGFNPSQFAASPNSSRLPSLQQWANHSRQNEANLPHPDSSDGSRIYEEVHLNDGKQNLLSCLDFPKYIRG